MLQRLVSERHNVHALVRDPGKAAKAGLIGVEYLAGDVVSGAGIDAAMQGCDAVVHLVGIIMEKKTGEKGSNTFDAVHHIGTRNLVEAAKRNGIKRFVQMSALGVRVDGVAAYQTSKWLAKKKFARAGSRFAFCGHRSSLVRETVL